MTRGDRNPGVVTVRKIWPLLWSSGYREPPRGALGEDQGELGWVKRERLATSLDLMRLPFPSKRDRVEELNFSVL